MKPASPSSLLGSKLASRHKPSSCQHDLVLKVKLLPEHRYGELLQHKLLALRSICGPHVRDVEHPTIRALNVAPAFTVIGWKVVSHARKYILGNSYRLLLASSCHGIVACGGQNLKSKAECQAEDRESDEYLYEGEPRRASVLTTISAHARPFPSASAKRAFRREVLHRGGSRNRLSCRQRRSGLRHRSLMRWRPTSSTSDVRRRPGAFVQVHRPEYRSVFGYLGLL